MSPARVVLPTDMPADPPSHPSPSGARPAAAPPGPPRTRGACPPAPTGPVSAPVLAGTTKPVHPDSPTPPGGAPPAATTGRRLPAAVYVLGLSVFALGTSEFMLSGLLPPLAADLEVSIPTAGLLISAFAIGMVVGAPVLAAATLRLPRRLTLIWLLAIFALGQVVGAVAPSYALLFASRVVSALACAGFWAVGAAVAVSMVPAGSRARAMSVLLSGLSIANIAGVPGGAVLGQHFGWRASFWAVAAMSLVGLVGVVALVPRTPPTPAARRPELRRELRLYRVPMVWLAVVTTALFAAATFCFFSYLAPLLTEVAGLDERWVPVVLTLYGVGALLGTLVGGRTADAHLFPTLFVALGSATGVLLLIGVTAGSPGVLVGLSALLGFTAFTAGPALNARLFNLAEAAPTLAGATNTAAFNLGNTVGPWLGGVVIDAGLGYARTALAGGVLCAAAVGATALQVRAERARARRARHPGAGRPPGAGTPAR